jgi:hypothetical protein
MEDEMSGAFGRPRRRWKDSIRTDLKEEDGQVWTVFTAGTSGRIL